MMKKICALGLMVGLCLFWAGEGHAVNLNVFGDVTYGDSSKDGDPGGFSLGQLDFWATQTLDAEGRFKAFFELVVESPGSGFVIDLERIWVEYDTRSNLRIRAGRMHTALGYWNRIHHHGSHMQTTVGRPLFLDFEDGSTAIFPTHAVGVMGITDHETALGAFHLELQLGNGASFNGEELDPNNAGDNDGGKGFGGRLSFYPNRLEGLGLALSVNMNEPKRFDSTSSLPRVLV